MTAIHLEFEASPPAAPVLRARPLAEDEQSVAIAAELDAMRLHSGMARGIDEMVLDLMKKHGLDAVQIGASYGDPRTTARRRHVLRRVHRAGGSSDDLPAGVRYP